MEKITREKADYVIAGDYHGYYREKRGKCTYLVTGGGGSNLKPKIYGRFHHAVKVTVREDGSVAEDILEVEKKTNLEDRLEYWALIYVHPFLNAYPIAGLAFLISCGFGAFMAGWGALVSLSPKRKRKTSGDSGARGQDVERELSPRTTGGSR
jgi:hypothetical protein